MDDAVLCLNARVGRSLPMPWSPAPIRSLPSDAARGRAACRPHWSGRLGSAARSHGSAIGLLGALLAALWPHWVWMARRLSDGSDEPWGILALATVFALVAGEWRLLRVPSPAVLAATAALAVSAALARIWVPPLAAAALAMGALAIWLAASRPDRPATPLAGLLLLGLPVIATLQFYLGYPLRYVTASLAAPVLHAFGFDVAASGAALAYRGGLVLVDPPCAGIGMLWVGAYTAALLSYLGNATTARTIGNATVAAASVFIANAARNVVLFLPESHAVGWPAWAHPAVGLAAFAVALLPIVWFARRGTQRARVQLLRQSRSPRRLP